jgi:hypothetical protein
MSDVGKAGNAATCYSYIQLPSSLSGGIKIFPTDRQNQIHEYSKISQNQQTSSTDGISSVYEKKKTIFMLLFLVLTVDVWSSLSGASGAAYLEQKE